MVACPCWVGACLACLMVVCLHTPASGAQIAVSTQAPRQGQTMEVVIWHAGPTSSSSHCLLTFHGRSYRAFVAPGERDSTVTLSEKQLTTNGAQHQDGQGSRYAALIGIPADMDPGSYKVQFGRHEKTIVVLPTRFPVQKISLPKHKETISPSPGEKEAVDKAKSTVSDTRLWQGRFAVPSKARVSAGFGLRRVVNGKPIKDYFHSGIDYAALLGTPVRACASGRVVLANSLFKLHGKTICLDHGQGVVSFYLHMQKILVKLGQTIKAGEIIGSVGQSGRANGPHLHFSLYVNEVATNPDTWFARGF